MPATSVAGDSVPSAWPAQQCPARVCVSLIGGHAQVSHLSARRQELLRREYMTSTGAPAQPPHGFQGQLHACWTHKFSDADARAIVQGVQTTGTQT